MLALVYEIACFDGLFIYLSSILPIYPYFKLYEKSSLLRITDC